MKNTPHLLHPLSKSQVAILILLGFILLINIEPMFLEYKKVHDSRKLGPHNLVGYKFFGLEQYLKNEEFVGYYTNENMEDKDPQKLFAHAQYILAPTILDFGNFDHEYILLVCSSEAEAFRKMNEIDAQPLLKNQYNVILAKRNKP